MSKETREKFAKGVTSDSFLDTGEPWCGSIEKEKAEEIDSFLEQCGFEGRPYSSEYKAIEKMQILQEKIESDNRIEDDIFLECNNVFDFYIELTDILLEYVKRKWVSEEVLKTYFDTLDKIKSSCIRKKEGRKCTNL